MTEGWQPSPAMKKFETELRDLCSASGLSDSDIYYVLAGINEAYRRSAYLSQVARLKKEYQHEQN